MGGFLHEMWHSQSCLISYLNESLVTFEQSQNEEHLCFIISKANFKNYDHVRCSTMFLKLMYFSLSGKLDLYMWTWRMGTFVLCPLTPPS